MQEKHEQLQWNIKKMYKWIKCIIMKNGNVYSFKSWLVPLE